MKRYLIYLMVLFLFLNLNSQAQDTVYLISGKIINGIVQKKDFKKDNYFFIDIKQKNKIKNKLIETEDVYSISYQDGKSEILYSRDSAKSLFFDQLEMYNYMLGEQVAFKMHKTSKYTIAGGALSGIAGGLVGLYGLLSPSAYAVFVSIYEPKVQFDEAKLPSKDYADYYDMGYRSVARTRNIKNAIISGFSGIILTGAIITIFDIDPFGLNK